MRDVTDNKTFCKVNLQIEMLLVEKGNDLNDPEISSRSWESDFRWIEIAKTFSEFFVNIVPSLKILPKENYETDVENITSQP